jgi:hypothetical protein
MRARDFAPHPYFVYELTPGVVATMGSARASINSLGFRGDSILPRKRPERRRILCLGGSFTFGVGLNEPETYPARLGAVLGSESWEVANLGVPGYTSHEIAGSFTLHWIDFDPDAIVIGDLDADALALETQNYRNDYGNFWKTWVSENPAADPESLGARVVRRWPGGEADRARALESANSDAFEINLGFLLDAASARSMKVVVCLPDTRARAGEAEKRAVALLRESARRVVARRGVHLIDPEAIPGGPLPPRAEASAFAAAAARLLRNLW